MRVKYKRVKELMPHCGDCGDKFLGNNSTMSPYKCSCGTWESKSWDEPFEFVLKSEE